MKIYAAKRDDLMRARYDYDTLTDQYQKKVDEGARRARYASDEVAAYIEDEVRNQIGSTSLNLVIDVRTDWDHNQGRSFTTWRVNVEAPHGDGRALGWHWAAKLDAEGNVIKESGSWSGLQAITPEQIDELEESVRVLKVLNSIDWKPILNKAIPSYDDYMDKEALSALHDRKKNRPDFDAQILEADIEDAIAAGEWIKLEGRPETDYYRGANRGTFWCKIDSMTDKFVKCHIAREYEGSIRNDLATDERLAKAKLFRYIAKPFESKAL